MLLRAKKLADRKIEAKDGEIGKPEEFLFDDREWNVRYLVVDTGSWLEARKVLISPQSILESEVDDKTIRLDLTKQQIENSPSVERHEPVSRQKEIILHRYYGWVPYFPFGGVMGYAIAAPVVPVSEQRKDMEQTENADPDLRSTEEVQGYHIGARDGSIGHVDDFIIDSQQWIIRYMVVDTKNWLPGKNVLIGTSWIEDVVWDDEKVFIDMTKDQIKSSPEFEETEQISREYEESLHEHYGQTKYWQRA